MGNQKQNLSIIFLILCFVIFSISLLPSCNAKKESGSNKKVEIRKENGRYDFFVDGKLFKIKGAGLDFKAGQDFKALAAAGANTFRTWRTDNASMELDSALKYDLKIAMGLDMEKELHDFDYNDEEAVAEQFESLKKQVLTYKDHPALLCWVVGNELNLLIKDDGSLGVVNPKVYDALADIVAFIREVDPDHPITTTFAAGAIKSHVEACLERCPDLDFLSYQVYNGLATLPQQEMANNIDLPYLVTEYGPKGHWEMPSTSWGREIEENSTQKAEGLRERLKKGFTTDTTGRNMGGYAFVWGQKQERTPTWYGIFNKDGKATAVADELALFWSGSYPANRAPAVSSMKLDGKVSTDNIMLAPNTSYPVHVIASDYEGDKLSYKWQLMKEVDVKSQGGALEKEPEQVAINVKTDGGGTVQLLTPEEKGEYRLFCYIYDEHKVGNANIPFVVK